MSDQVELRQKRLARSAAGGAGTRRSGIHPRRFVLRTRLWLSLNERP